MKKEILTFSNKISHHLSTPNKKFTADMTYDMLSSSVNCHQKNPSVMTGFF